MRRIQELIALDGRRAFVAGGAGKVGRAAGAALAELGARVAVCDLDDGACAEVAQSLGRSGVAIAADLADEREARRAVREAAAALGGLDILVHAAALVGATELEGWAVPFEEQTVAAWDAALRVNVTSAFVVAQEACGPLAESGHGSVVLIGSIYGGVGPVPSLYEGTAMANPVGYGASKGALLQLMRYLSAELAPQIRVNAVSPGGIERGQPEQFQARYAERTPLRRMATEEDVVGAVAYLASDLSAYVTGQNLVVDGGWTVW